MYQFKIHWRMLILECSQGCYAVKFWPCYLDLWPMRLGPWKSIGFQIVLRTKHVPSLVKIHWRMLILEFTRMLCGKNLTWWPWQSIGFQILLRTKYVPSITISLRSFVGKGIKRRDALLYKVPKGPSKYSPKSTISLSHSETQFTHNKQTDFIFVMTNKF